MVRLAELIMILELHQQGMTVLGSICRCRRLPGQKPVAPVEGDWLLDAGSPEIHKLAVVFDAVVFDCKRRVMRSTCCASAAREMRSSHQGALPLPLSQPAVSETHAKASGMWDNLLHQRITKLSNIVGPDAQRTRDNRSNQR